MRLGLYTTATLILLACADPPKDEGGGAGGTRNDAKGGTGGSMNGSGDAGDAGSGEGGRGESDSEAGAGGALDETDGSSAGGAGGEDSGEAGAGGSIEPTVGGAGGEDASGGVANLGGGGSGGESVNASGLPLPGPGGLAAPSGEPGNLKVLDWAGFKAAVSYTFDDSNSSQILNYDALQALGVRYTFYLQTNKPESTNPIWLTALADGHELGNHTKSHASGGTAEDVDEATDFLKSTFDVEPWTMAAPYGESVYAEYAKTRFLVNRGVANGLVAPNDSTDPFNLPCYIPPENASESAFNEQIDTARTLGRWRIVLVHGFIGGSDYAYNPVELSEFVASVEHAKSFGDMWIDSVVHVAAYWRAQKAFSLTTPEQSGDETTWSWTLPDNFPPGQYLRVTVSGGSLSQNGTELPWNDHGFYEVALDEGSLTLSP